MDREPRNSRIVAVFIGVGVLCGMAVGAVITMLLRDRKPGLAGGAAGVNVYNMLGGSQPHLLSSAFAQPQPVVQTVTPEVAAEMKPSNLVTLTLSTTSATRVLTATGLRHQRAQLRNVGPPGSIARVSADPTALAFSSMCASIPPGPAVEVRVRPGDALFAVGNVPNVQLSIIAFEDDA